MLAFCDSSIPSQLGQPTVISTTTSSFTTVRMRARICSTSRKLQEPAARVSPKPCVCLESELMRRWIGHHLLAGRP
jgi:hypothetical protein